MTTIPAAAGRRLVQRRAVMRPRDRETGTGSDVIGRRADKLDRVATNQTQWMLNGSAARDICDVDHHSGYHVNTTVFTL